MTGTKHGAEAAHGAMAGHRAESGHGAGYVVGHGVGEKHYGTFNEIIIREDIFMFIFSRPITSPFKAKFADHSPRQARSLAQPCADLRSSLAPTLL